MGSANIGLPLIKARDQGQVCGRVSCSGIETKFGRDVGVDQRRVVDDRNTNDGLDAAIQIRRTSKPKTIGKAVAIGVGEGATHDIT